MRQRSPRDQRTKRKTTTARAVVGRRSLDATPTCPSYPSSPHLLSLSPPPSPRAQVVGPRAQTAAASAVAESAAAKSGLTQHDEAAASRVGGATATAVASPDVVSQDIESSSKRPSSRSVAVRATSASRRPGTGTGTAPPGSARVVSASARSATAGKSVRPASTANGGTADAINGVTGGQLTNIARDQLQPLPNPEEAMATTEQLLREGTLQSLLKALGLLRRLVAFHSSLIQPCMCALAQLEEKGTRGANRQGRCVCSTRERSGSMTTGLSSPPFRPFICSFPPRSDDMALLTNRCLVHNSNTVRTVAALVVGDMCSVFGDDMLRHLHGTQPGNDPLILSLLNVATGAHRGAAAAASSTLKCVSGRKGEGKSEGSGTSTSPQRERCWGMVKRAKATTRSAQRFGSPQTGAHIAPKAKATRPLQLHLRLVAVLIPCRSAHLGLSPPPPRPLPQYVCAHAQPGERGETARAIHRPHRCCYPL